jgi:hypothetical protein
MARVKAKAIAVRNANGGKLWSRRLNHRYYFAKSRAKRYGRAFDLTMTEYLEFTKQPCHYCHGPLPEYGTGLDRGDCSLGYTKENIIPCCGQCNRIKSDVYSVAEMEIIGSVLKDIAATRAVERRAS